MALFALHRTELLVPHMATVFRAAQLSDTRHLGRPPCVDARNRRRGRGAPADAHDDIERN
jgi:hypothetical protein